MNKIRVWIIGIVAVLAAGALYSYGVWPRPIYDTSIGSGSYDNSGPMTGKMSAEQTFVCGDNGLSGIRIRLSKLEHQTVGTYSYTVTEEETGKVVAEGKIDKASVETKLYTSRNAQKKENVVLAMPRQAESKGKEYTLTVTALGVKEEESLGLYLTEKGDGAGTLILDGKESAQTSVIRLMYKRFNIETFIVFLGIMAYLGGFVKFMYRLFR